MFLFKVNSFVLYLFLFILEVLEYFFCKFSRFGGIVVVGYMWYIFKGFDLINNRGSFIVLWEKKLLMIDWGKI